MSDLKNGNIAINSKTSKEKLMTFSPVMEYKVSLKNTKFQNQSHLGWYFTRENVEFPDQILSPELKEHTRWYTRCLFYKLVRKIWKKTGLQIYFDRKTVFLHHPSIYFVDWILLLS